MEENQEIIPQPSDKMREFLSSSGFFSQNSQAPISRSSDNSFFSTQNISPVASTSQNNMQGIYNQMIQNKISEMPIIAPKQAEITFPDVSNLIKPTSSLSAQQAAQGIGDIKSRTDRMQSLESSVPINTAYSTSDSGGANNITNNSSVTNVTQVTPDYIMGLKLSYAKLPVWRQSMG